MRNKLVDKEWLAADDSESQYKDNIYVVYSELIPIDIQTVNAEIVAKTLRPGVDSFENRIVLSTGDYSLVQFSSIDVGRNGKVHITFFGQKADGTQGMYYVQSNDGGASFSVERKIADVHLPVLSSDEPNNPVVGIEDTRLYPCPHLVADHTGSYVDHLYLTWTANGKAQKETNGLDVYFSRSTNDGQTWSDPIVLNADLDPNSHQYYSSITMNPDGKVIVSWYDRRNDPNNLMTEYFMTWSENGGDSFVDEICTSTQPSNFAQIGQVNGDFGIGEYTQIVATKKYAFPFWADGRTNNGDIDVYVARVDLTDITIGIHTIGSITDQIAVSGPVPNRLNRGNAFHLNLDLKQNSPIQISLVNQEGKEIQVLFDQNLSAGEHGIDLAANVSAGAYIIKVQSKFGLYGTRLMIF